MNHSPTHIPKEKEEELIKQKDQAYWERNQLVAALSKIYPSWLGRHEYTDKTWDREWMNIVFIEIPTKYRHYPKVVGVSPYNIKEKQQLSWHIHDSELENFSHLQYRNDKKWDGHTTEEKYKRLRNIYKRKWF